MPTIFQGRCRNCGHQTYLSEGYAAVLVDQLRPEVDHGETTRSGMLLVPLRHPLESFDLAKTGYTIKELFWQGRYIASAQRICRRCGTQFFKRRLARPGTVGCVTALSIGAAAGLVVAVMTRRLALGAVSVLPAVILASLGVELFGWLYLRTRFPERTRALAEEAKCPSCGVDDSAGVGMWRSVCCSGCKRKSLRLVPVGVF